MLPFLSKEDPYNLMTDEMLERVPELYEQEKISLAEKKFMQHILFHLEVTGLGI